jgi:hypothetical protein
MRYVSQVVVVRVVKRVVVLVMYTEGAGLGMEERGFNAFERQWYG